MPPRGEYVCFLDSDDEWLEDKLQRQIDLLATREYNIIHGEEIWIRNGKRVNPRKIHQKYGGWIFEKCLPRCLISPSAAMVKRELLLELGGFDEQLPVCEDYDLWARITSRHEVGFVKRPIIVKYGGASDQLSRKYKGMDYYRILSLDRIRREGSLTDGQKAKVLEEMNKKAAIFMAGCLKHGNRDQFQATREILMNSA